MPCSCEWTPGIDLPTTECAQHRDDPTLAHRVQAESPCGDCSGLGVVQCGLCLGTGYQESRRPCPYCCSSDCGEPEGGFAPVHAECQRSVDRYVREAEGV